MIEAPVSLPLRIAFGAVGVLPLLAPYQLLVRPAWSDYAHPLFLFALLVSFVAVAVGLFFLMGAFAGLATRMRFDRGAGRFTHTTAAPAARSRTRSEPLASLREVAVDTQAWTDGPATYSLRVVAEGDAAYSLGPFLDRADAEAAAAKARAYLQPRA